MAINITSIEDALISWINLVDPSITAIMFYQDEPRPAKPYVTINIINFNSIGHDAKTGPDVNDIENVIGNREFTLSMSAYGGDHNQTFEIIEKLATSLQKSIIIEAIEENGISFMRFAGGITDLTEKLETKYEHRANLDFIFSVQSIESEVVDVIENINITGDLKDEAGNTITTEEINIT